MPEGQEMEGGADLGDSPDQQQQQEMDQQLDQQQMEQQPAL